MGLHDEQYAHLRLPCTAQDWQSAASCKQTSLPLGFLAWSQIPPCWRLFERNSVASTSHGVATTMSAEAVRQ